MVLQTKRFIAITKNIIRSFIFIQGMTSFSELFLFVRLAVILKYNTKNLTLLGVSSYISQEKNKFYHVIMEICAEQYRKLQILFKLLQFE